MEAFLLHLCQQSILVQLQFLERIFQFFFFDGIFSSATWLMTIVMKIMDNSLNILDKDCSLFQLWICTEILWRDIAAFMHIWKIVALYTTKWRLHWELGKLWCEWAQRDSFRTHVLVMTHVHVHDDAGWTFAILFQHPSPNHTNLEQNNAVCLISNG